MAIVEPASDELVALVGGLSSVRMDDYAVVGSYMRFGERVREQLKDARLRIAEACATPATEEGSRLMQDAVARLREVADGRTVASSLHTYATALAQAGEAEQALP